MDPGTENEESTLLGHSVDPTVFCDSPDIVPTISQLFSQGTEDYLQQSIMEECGVVDEIFGADDSPPHYQELVCLKMENASEIQHEFVVPEESNVLQVIESFQPLGGAGNSQEGLGTCCVKTEGASIASGQSTDFSEPEGTIFQECTKSFAGNYDFSVQIRRDFRSTGVFFSEVWNKLYCTPFTEVGFNFCCKFDGPEDSGLNLVTFLLFADSSRLLLPVSRCRNHAEKDRKKLQQDPDVSSDKIAMLEHIIKCKDDRSVYWKDAVTGHLGVTSPMFSSRSSGGNVLKRFQFDCLNTCQPNVRGRREQILLVFELHEGVNVVGRICLNLRVCSLPRRDLLIDDAPVQDRRVSKRKLEKDNGKSRKLEETKGPTLQAPDSDVQTEQRGVLENLSQESGMSDMNFDAITEKPVMTKQMLKQAKLILSHADDESQIVRYVARNFAREIRKTARLLGSALEHDDFRKNNERAATAEATSRLTG